MICSDCDRKLSLEEIDHYEDRCERCESLWQAHMELWRQGKIEDKDLDRKYGDHQL